MDTRANLHPVFLPGIVAGAILTVGVVIAFWPTRPTPSPTGAVSSARAAGSSVAGAAIDGAASTGETIRADLPTPVFVDEENGAELFGVGLIPLDSTPSRSVPVCRCIREASTTDLGRRPWLVYLPGYLPVVVDAETAWPVRLGRAASLVVTVQDRSGDPVGGVAVALFPERGIRPSRTCGERAVGDPRSREPVWSGSTDGRGRLSFDTLPPGRFRLKASHGQLFADDEVGTGRVGVDAPGVAVVEMDDLFAVAVVAPPGRRILRHYWRRPDPQDTSLGVVEGRAQGIAWLAEEFPSAVSFVGRPKRGRIDPPTFVECVAFLDGCGVGRIRWPLTPIRELQDPVVLEIDQDATARELVVKVMDRVGRPLPIRLRLVASDRRTVHRTTAGEPIPLLADRYKLIPVSSPVWIEREFEDAWVVIGKDDPPVTIREFVLREPMRLLRVVPRWPDPESASAVHVTISDEAGDGTSIVNWTPSRGAIECLVPLGPVRVMVEGVACETEEVKLTVRDGEGALVQEVPLTRVGLPRGK